MKIKIIILLIGGFIVLALVGLGLLGYFVEKQEIVQPEISKESEIKVSSFIGKIVEIRDNFIKIQVSASQNQGIEQDNAIITIKPTAATKFIEKDEILEIKKDIAFSDLKINDEIIATSQENIAWQKEFTAQYVLRIK